jgi:endonuclease-3
VRMWCPRCASLRQRETLSTPELGLQSPGRCHSGLTLQFASACLRRECSCTLLLTMKKTDIAPFFATLREANPHPKTELEYTSDFELLTAVLLSAQATDVGVNKATRKLFPVANTPQAILDLGIEGLESYIKTIGLYRSKAKHLMETCRILVECHDSKVPNSREELEALPGVGRKTANVVLNVAFGQPTMAVDTHIFRVSNRTGLAPGKTPLEVEKQLLKRVPAEFAVDSHHWLILLGRYVCQARKPRCWECLVTAYCDFQPKSEAPKSGK